MSADKALQCSFCQRKMTSRQHRRLVGELPSDIEGLKVQIRSASISFAPYEAMHRISPKIKGLLTSGASMLTVCLTFPPDRTSKTP